MAYPELDPASANPPPNITLKYSPTQPRVSSGNSDGGQWTDGGGGGGTPSGGGSSSTSRVADNSFGGSAGSGNQTPSEAPLDQADQEAGRRVVNDYAKDGSISGQTVTNRDGSRIKSEFHSANGEWDERHTVTSADGSTFSVETLGNAQKIMTGDNGETLIGTSEWTPDGPELRLQPALFDREKAIARAAAGLLALGAWLASRATENSFSVLAFKANEYAPGEPEPIWVGTRSREEVDRACPEHGRVQGLTDEAADIVTREGNYFGQADFGTKVHTRLKSEIRVVGHKNLRSEDSFIKSADESYGKRGSIRIDVLENTGNGTVCVYDIKTGRRGLSLPRSKEIASNVQKVYPGTQRIIVIETRPGNK